MEDRLKEEDRLASKIRSPVSMGSIQTAAVVVVGTGAAVNAEGDCGHVVGGATAAAPTGVDDGAPFAAAFVAAVAAAPFAIAYAVASVIAAVVAESEVARRASCLHG